MWLKTLTNIQLGFMLLIQHICIWVTEKCLKWHIISVSELVTIVQKNCWVTRALRVCLLCLSCPQSVHEGLHVVSVVQTQSLLILTSLLGVGLPLVNRGTSTSLTVTDPKLNSNIICLNVCHWTLTELQFVPILCLWVLSTCFNMFLFLLYPFCSFSRFCVCCLDIRVHSCMCLR